MSTGTLDRVSGEPWTTKKNQGTTPRLTLDIEMRGPIALDVRGHSLTPSMQVGVVAGTDSGRGGIEIVELCWQRWQGRRLGRVLGFILGLLTLPIIRLALGLDLGIVLVAVGRRVIDERHVEGSIPFRVVATLPGQQRSDQIPDTSPLLCTLWYSLLLSTTVW